MSKVILISGHAQNGKDTSASYIKEYLESKGNRVQIMHYADLLKYICKQYFGWDGQKNDKGRQMLQYVGTNVVREKRPNFWVEWLSAMIDLFKDEWDYVLIPDTRFPNEVELIKETCDRCWHIRVVRPNFKSPLTEEQQKHPSETALDGYKPEYTIYNDGTLADLRAASIELAWRITKE